jgi:hypothetical protein
MVVRDFHRTDPVNEPSNQRLDGIPRNGVKPFLTPNSRFTSPILWNLLEFFLVELEELPL